MSRRSLLVVLAVVASACTQTAPDRAPLPDVTTTTGAPSTTAAEEPTTTTTRAVTQSDPVDAPGRLAIVDLSGEVILSSADGSERSAITLNGFQALHRQPVWSPDGTRLAFAEGTSEGAFVVIVQDGLEVNRLPVLSLPFYLQWDDTGSQIGILRNDPGTTFAVDVAPVIGADGFSSPGGGAPLYFDWEPAGDRLSLHPSDTEVEVAGSSTASSPLDVDTGPYQVPHWTVGGISHVAAVGDGYELRIIDPGGATVSLAAMASVVQVVADPAGERLAVYVPPVGEEPDVIDVSSTEVPAIDWSSFVVVDVTTGEVTEVARGQILSYFWAPDGEKILYFGLDESGGPVWKVWDESTGDTVAFPALRLGDEFLQQILPFFEQYALSMQLWAPDSSAFAYPVQTEAGAAIFVQSLEGREPQFVSSGTWVSWSPG